MKLTIALTGIYLLLVCPKSIEARDPITNNALAKTDQDLRGIRDVWYTIKASAIQSWRYIKGVAEKTMIKIGKWVDSAKQYVNQIKETFEEKVQDLKDKFNTIISNAYGTGQRVKICFTAEKEHMDAFIKTIMQNMAVCVSDEIKKIPFITNNNTIKEYFNETEFRSKLDYRIALCEQNSDQEIVHECIFKVRGEIFDLFATAEQNLLKSRFEIKGLIDDIQTSVVTCSMNNIVNTTNFVTNEAVEIIKCVMETKNGNEIESK